MAQHCPLFTRDLVKYISYQISVSFVDVAVAIPTEPNGGNHTIGFTNAAATVEAHEATLLVTKGLAHTALRALRDDDFFKQVSTQLI
jgi:hypothetical protein